MKIHPISEVKPASLKTFDCGIQELNTYLNRFAKKNDKLGIGRTYILQEGTTTMGYYTISMAQVNFTNLPTASQAKIPRYPVPAARIGKLAVDQRSQGKGLGERLLMDALSKCLEVSDVIALYAVVVDAKNHSAKKFYLNFGFIPLENSNLSLFLPIKTLQQL